MRIINALLANWKTKTTEEKIKTILHGITMIGGSVIGTAVGDQCAEGKGPVSAVCAKVTGIALGGIVADKAAKYMDETVDQFSELLKERKNKEGTANA